MTQFDYLKDLLKFLEIYSSVLSTVLIELSEDFLMKIKTNVLF